MDGWLCACGVSLLLTWLVLLVRMCTVLYVLAVHIFGHSHLPVDATVGGVRYIQRALGYPRDWGGFRGEPQAVWTAAGAGAGAGLTPRGGGGGSGS